MILSLKTNRIQYFLLLIFILTLQIVSAQKFDNPKSYLEFIDSHNGSIVSQTWSYMYLYTNSDDVVAIKGQRKKLENLLNASLRKINKAETFDQDLQKAAVHYIDGNLKIIKNEMISLIDSRTERTVSIDQIALLQQIRKALFELRANYDLAMTDYGSKYDLKIVQNESKLAKQMAHTIDVYDYYHTIHIEFSKLQLIESNLWNGINDKTWSTLKSDITEASHRLLSDEDIAQLSNFKGDKSLIVVLSLFNSYLIEAIDNRLNAVLILKKDQQSGNRDQIRVKTDNYNMALQWSNKERRSIYDQWSSAYKVFLKKHINEF